MKNNKKIGKATAIVLAIKALKKGNVKDITVRGIKDEIKRRKNRIA